MGLLLGGQSAYGRIMIHSDRYAALAEYNETSATIIVTIAPLTEISELKLKLEEKELNRVAAIIYVLATIIFMISILFFLLLLTVFSSSFWENDLASYLYGLMIVYGLMGFIPVMFFWNSKRGRAVARYHAAEHKAIDAYERFCTADLDKIKAASRVKVYCGSIFLASQLVYAVIFPIAGLLSGQPLFWLIYLLWCGSVLLPSVFWLNPLVIGASLLIQYFWATREPTDTELKLAQAALNRLLEIDDTLPRK